MIFNIPAVDNLCRLLHDGVTACGGPEKFFDSLTDDPRGTIEKVLPDFDDAQILKTLIDNDEYRNNFINQIPNDDDKVFVLAFIQGWKLWARLYPEQSRDLTLYIIPMHEILAQENIPNNVNDVMGCITRLSLDAFYEEFLTRTVLKLWAADKKIGGDDVLVMTGTLIGFLSTIQLMINSLKLATTERELFLISENTRIITDITERFDELEKTIRDIRLQFETMKVK